MKIVPAIDLRHGQCVRLLHGVRGSETVYGDDPRAMARHWAAEGAEMLHVVDLDAAFGEPAQRDTIATVLSAVDVPVQVGGGVRTVDDFVELVRLGASRVVFGTVAVQAPEVVERSLDEAADRVVIGADAKNGQVAVKGWTQTTEESPIEFARRWMERGATTFLYTDVGRDGAMTGSNVDATQTFAEETRARVIASGGVGALEHLEPLRHVPGVESVIVGKALYENAFTLAEAIASLRT